MLEIICGRTNDDSAGCRELVGEVIGERGLACATEAIDGNPLWVR
jgi:hypothetical protein